MARVVINRASLNRTMASSARRELASFSRKVVNRAKILTPVDTGRLRSSVSFTVHGFVSEIGTTVDYAKFVHDGTRPHVIRPRRREVLRFRVGGNVVYAREVRHPGTRARPFLDRALREVAAREGWTYRGGGIG